MYVGYFIWPKIYYNFWATIMKSYQIYKNNGKYKFLTNKSTEY